MKEEVFNKLIDIINDNNIVSIDCVYTITGECKTLIINYKDDSTGII